MIDITALKRQFNLRMNSESERYNNLDFRENWLNGTLYDDIIYPFYMNREESSDYVPLRQRRPSVVYNLAKIMTDRSTDMVFGEAHWPTISSDPKNKSTEVVIGHLVEESDFQRQWRKASRMGAVGSVAVVFKITDGKLYHEVLNAKYCQPTFSPRKPDELVSLVEKRKVFGHELIACGFSGIDPDERYLYRRDFTTTEEIEYFPVAIKDAQKEGAFTQWKRNDERSFTHNLGFVPGVWIKNLESEDAVDGTATFEGLLTFQTEIDYQLSQIGRVFHYTGDPQIVIKDPSLQENDGEAQIRSAGNALLLNEDGDAFNLEIQAEAQRVNLDYIEKLRKFALEVARGNRADPDKISSSQSGRALALLHKDLIGLADELRTSYGKYGLKIYIKKVLKAAKKIGLDYPEISKELKTINPEAPLILNWGAYFDPTPSDDREQAMFLTESVNNGSISENTATRRISDRVGVTDVEAERAQIKKERDEADARAMKLDQAQQASQASKSKLVNKKSSAPPEK